MVKASISDSLDVVCFGGGSVVPEVVLPGFNEFTNYNIASATSMVDSGGSTGELREEFDILPPGDIRRHLLALSDAAKWKRDLWKFRFGKGENTKEHSFGNAFLAGIEHTQQNFETALNIAHEFLEVNGNCLPCTLDKIDLVAEFENGLELVGEHKVDVYDNRDPELGIEEVRTEPKSIAYPPLLETIKTADLITIGPGDLYTSLIPCFLPDGMSEAFKKTDATIVFLVPLLTKLGETIGMSVKDMTEELERYLGTELDYVIYNNQEPSEEVMEEHKKRSPHLTKHIEIDVGSENDKYVGEELLDPEGLVVHDSRKVVETICDII